jgi:hypothetical protein
VKVSIHCEPSIAWQSRRARFFLDGFRQRGIEAEITSDRFRHDGFPVLLGTTCWRDIERSGDYLLVDRCSFGDTDRFVTIVRGGHGRRGDHHVPVSPSPARWERYGVDLGEWRKGGSRVVLCGQHDTWSPHYARAEDWYATVRATHFRPHPAGYADCPYPKALTFDDCRQAVTLNSSVGVQCVLAGIPTVTMDEGAMAWDVTSHVVGEIATPDRLPWCHWIAWTQWTDDEIREGEPWKLLLSG